MASAAASFRNLDSRFSFSRSTLERRTGSVHAQSEQKITCNRFRRHAQAVQRAHWSPPWRPSCQKKTDHLSFAKHLSGNAVAHCLKDRSYAARVHSWNARTCIVKATAGASVYGSHQNPSSPKTLIVYPPSDELPIRLPPPPKDSSILNVLPYLWKLATGDRTLRWRVALSLVLLVGGKVRAPLCETRFCGAALLFAERKLSVDGARRTLSTTPHGFVTTCSASETGCFAIDSHLLLIDIFR
jgi:hypothetical protein